MSNIDKQCRSLCKAINSISGLRTTSSCCGHGLQKYRIWFRAIRVNNLIDLLYWIDECHCGFREWEVIASTDCAKNGVHFCLQGQQGELAYKEADRIAELILKEQEEMEK